jgi:hypothetical protein
LGNVLSALSIILGMYVAIYLKWEDKINQAIDLPSPTHKVDGLPEYTKVKQTLISYVLPLCLTSLVLTLIILPEWLKIFTDSISVISNHGFKLKYYDIVSSIFLLLGLIFLSFSIYLMSCFIQLWKKMNNLNPNKL